MNWIHVYSCTSPKCTWSAVSPGFVLRCPRCQTPELVFSLRAPWYLRPFVAVGSALGRALRFVASTLRRRALP